MRVIARPDRYFFRSRPWWRWLWWRVGVQTSKTLSLRLQFDGLEHVPLGLSFKICGLSDVTARRERVRLYGRSQLLALGHEDSDRLVGTVVEHEGCRAVRLSAYAYREGYGGITASRGHTVPERWTGRLSHALLTVPAGDDVEVVIVRRADATVYGACSGQRSSVYRLEAAHPPSRFQKLEWGHADGGRAQRGTPVSFFYTFERIRT